MAKKTKKKSAPQKKGFWQSPAGYFISTAVLWVACYILASLAIDSGSILQWFGTLVALFWGLGRFIQGIIQVLHLKAYGKKR